MPHRRPGSSFAHYRRAVTFWAGAGLACAGIWFLTYQFSLDANLAAMRGANAQRLDYFGVSLENTLEKYEYLPFIVTLQREVGQLLRQPTDATLAPQVNDYLHRLQASARVAAVYVMDGSGRTLAASNAGQAGSFVGQNYGFRPYFRDALAGQVGKFYAVGATTGEPGYFLASPVVEGSRAVGVAAVKVSLAEIEDAWARSGEHLALADANGIIFLSSTPAWRYRSLAPLGEATREELARTRQYGPHVLRPLLGEPLVPAGAGQRLSMTLPAPAGANGPAAAGDTWVQSRSAGRLGWRLLLFTSLEPAHVAARNVATASSLAAAFLMLLYFYLRLRERRRQELAEARAQLERAHGELERRIADRTHDLVSTNARLHDKIRELHDAQRLLTETQNDLVQAGKLAILGQMAAGVTHELNQPLTAMRTLSDNTLVLMKKNQGQAAADNLVAIAQLTDRMGSIVGQLKAFSRKSNDRLHPVDVARALDDALRLVEARARDVALEVVREGPDTGATVLGDEVRLEQVFVNLLCNAIDAMAGRERPVLTLGLARRDGRVEITVGDNGAGLSVEAREHLFEPFYTTKPAGAGLGLGLTISLVIVRAMGGELRAANRAAGGAVFSVSLPEYQGEGAP